MSSISVSPSPLLEEEDHAEDCLRLTKQENSSILDLGGHSLEMTFIKHSAGFSCSIKLAVLYWSFPKQGCLPLPWPPPTYNTFFAWSLHPPAICILSGLWLMSQTSWSLVWLNPKFLSPSPKVSQIFSRSLLWTQVLHHTPSSWAPRPSSPAYGRVRRLIRAQKCCSREVDHAAGRVHEWVSQ